MKNKQYTKLFAASLIAVTPVLWGSCTDEWNDHYDTSSAMATAPSVLAAVQSDKDLAPFLKVLQATKYDEVLSSPNQLTVFGPVITDAQADSIIAVYNSEKARTNKDDDNKAIRQFIQNHISMYARNVSTGQRDTVSLLNKKYMILDGKSETTGSLKTLAGVGQDFTSKTIANNGFLYKTNGIVGFYSNIREYMDLTKDYSSENKYFASHDYYYLNESASVPGGVKDGKTTYLDSVTYIVNPIESMFDGYINAEDSSYIYVAPTNEVYQSLYDQYSKYFTYITDKVDEDYTDSITNLMIHYGRFFNANSGHNASPADSLVNTMYSQYQTHWKTQNDRSNVWYGIYNPFTGTYFGKTPQYCSNGIIIKDDVLGSGDVPNSGVIDKEKTFFRSINMEAEYGFYYDVDKDATTGKNIYNTTTRQAYDEIVTSDSVVHKFDVSNNAFVEVTRADGSTTQGVSITYRAPQGAANTLSNVPYNIYLVTAPALSNSATASDTLANRMSINMLVYGKDGTQTYFDGQTFQPKGSKTISMKNPEGFYERTNKGAYSWCEPWSKEYFVNKTNVVDTILIAKAVVFPTAGAYAPEGDGFEITINNFISTSYKKYYSPTLRLDRFIILPFDTKEEAENYDIKAANRKE